MTGKECKQFTKGFFQAFERELKKHKDLTAIELMKVRTGKLKPQDVREVFRNRVEKIGELRSFLYDTFRIAHLESSNFPEYGEAMEKWQDADKLIFNANIEIKKACEAAQRAESKGEVVS